MIVFITKFIKLIVYFYQNVYIHHFLSSTSLILANVLIPLSNNFLHFYISILSRLILQQNISCFFLYFTYLVLLFQYFLNLSAVLMYFNHRTVICVSDLWFQLVLLNSVFKNIFTSFRTMFYCWTILVNYNINLNPQDDNYISRVLDSMYICQSCCNFYFTNWIAANDGYYLHWRFLKKCWVYFCA